MIKKVILIALIAPLALGILAEVGKGKIYGIVKDQETQKPIEKATIYIKELSQSLKTNAYGNFNTDLDPGGYTLVVVHKNFDTTISWLNVEAEKMELIEVFMPKKVEMEVLPDSQSMRAVQITIKASKSSDHAALEIQKKSLNVSNGISSQTFKKTGDADAGAALNKIPGISVEGGKYVYVRGLGDRYTKTQLNGLDLPGIDPDRNTVQMDIFTTNLIDNIFVTKTFTADLPGDFTGGLVNIITKDFPTNKTTSYAASLGYNANMHLRNDYLTYDGGTADAFALGARNRAIPVNPNEGTPLAIPGQQKLETMTRAFSPEMAAKYGNSFIDYSLGYSIGSQLKSKDRKRTHGYNFALNHQTNYRHFDEVIYGQYAKDRDKRINELQKVSEQKGSQSEYEAAWSGLFNASTKTKNNKYSFTLFHSRNGLKQTALLRSEATSISSAPGAVLGKNILYYNQRNVTTVNISGNHKLLGDKKTLNWSIAPSVSNNKEPDLRQAFFAYEDNGDITLNIGDGARVTRMWRSLKEYGLNSKMDLLFTSPKSNWKTGIALSIKNRDFGINRYEFRDIASRNDYTGDPNELFQASNLYSSENTSATGLIVQSENSQSNNYNSSLAVAGAYVHNEYHLSKKIRAISGFRLEYASMLYTGENQAGLSYAGQSVLNKISPLPTFALIYSPDKKSNIRLNASRTLARPSFKEKSLAQIFDAVTGRTFIGNLDLKQTDITNVDFRWEKFSHKGQVISASAFVKDFANPIELVAYKAETPDNFQARNVGKALVAGLEFEYRKSLTFISSRSHNFFFTTNISYIHSSVEMNESEYQGKKQEKRSGETVKKTRQMQGQSPYLVNARLNFKNNRGWQVNASYNVQGPRLAIVGIGVSPDVYEREFHSINVNIQKSIDQAKKWTVSLKATNLLMQKRVMYQKSYEARQQIFTQVSPFSTFKFSIRYTL